MKKKVVIIIASLMIVFGTILIINSNYTTVKADPGFDSSWDSSGWSSSSWDSGGSSWSSGSSWDYGGSSRDYGHTSRHSSGSGGNSNSPISAVFSLLIFGFMIMSIVFAILGSIKSKPVSTIVIPKLQKLDMNKVYSSLGKNFSIEKLNKCVFDKFGKYTECFNANDIKYKEDIFTPGMIESLENELSQLSKTNNQRIIKDINYQEAFISNIFEREGYIYIKYALRIHCKHYILNTNSNKALLSDENILKDCIYSVILRTKDKIVTPNVCPNCNEKITTKNIVSCPKCHSYFVNQDSDYLISLVTLLYIDKASSSESCVSTQVNKYGPISNEEIKQLLGENFNIEEFNQKVFDIYYKICIDWSNNDIGPSRGLLSDEMFNMYKTQLVTLTAKHERNVMEDIKLVGSTIKDVKVNNDSIEINSILKVTCRDYMINDNNNEVIRGNKNQVRMYTYSITLRADKLDEKIDKCPSCGSELDDKVSMICPYCHNLIVKKSSEFVMTSKNMITQEDLWRK